MVIVLAGAVLIVLAGCAAVPGAPESLEANGAADFGHTHGLGADPTTGETYAATHNGVWLVPTGQLPEDYLDGAERDSGVNRVQIAGRAQDTMGFTVAAPGLLLASGHPDPVEQPDLNPPNLGLISSTDGAKTWGTLSLRGETDFHDLDAVTLPDGALRIYGYDATGGMIQVSDDDGATWTARASIQLRDLAADRANPDRLYATTADGLLVSNDTGRSFEPVSAAPALFLIAAGDAESGNMVGIDTQGAIWSTSIEAGTWSMTGQTEGTPEALGYVVGSTPWILIADARGIVASDDLGATGTVLVPK